MRTAPPSDQSAPVTAALAALKWPLRLTWGGLWAEALLRAFWPVWSLLFLLAAALSFGAQDVLPDRLLWLLAGLLGLGLIGGLIYALRQFHRPTAAEALDRLDRSIPGRPITALADSQAVGAGDAASAAVWQAHLARAAARVAAIRAPRPNLRLASRDPYALRYAALLALVVAVLFGEPHRVGEVSGLAGPRSAGAVAAGPSWEGWIRPPDYTGRPTIYLNDARDEVLQVPEGSTVTMRLYGQVGVLGVEHDLSDRSAEIGGDFEVLRDGTLEVTGPGGRAWAIDAVHDLTPIIRFDGEMTREAEGQMRQPFSVNDDYGVVAGRAEIMLDLAAVDRRYGLAADPEPREPVVLDLPMPLTGERAEFSEALIGDLSQHPWANMPVRIRLFASDARGQEGESGESEALLPGRRFFDPLAAAVIELRRDLLWSRQTAPRVSQLLHAITHRPEGFIRSERAFLLLRVAMRRLDAGIAGGLDEATRDEITAALWEVAVLIEGGDLESARERLERAQDRLSEAIRNGADESEVAELMQEYREALQDYMRQLAQEADRDPSQQQAQTEDGMTMSGDQLQEMLDQLQQLMEEGRMAEAAEMLEMLRQMMENMQVVEGQGGQGQGQNPMQGLSDTLREQQELNDDTFRDLQERFGRGEQGGGDQGELSERQQALRDELEQQGQNLPGQGTPEGEAARRSLEEAGRAMEEAERALREGDGAGALDRQAEAMDALREGMRNLDEALAQEQGQGGQGEQTGQADPNAQRDPLGREPGATGRLGTDENLLPGEDVHRRAQELLEELRRRSGDQTRPEIELDYLRRLLDRF